ncbi:uncharacterized protein LY79DRAFT_555815 [Colletotrichum navitas]|uniref:Lysine-specific metallo-endopeptidase domain-containing protein n=1 Tax=Colletotrichum navitas TaxID=681940 RepID=A0AAD8PYU9_9PEZI|nr:uncharacterized protein LY79DRAFT_555815 [Colletotrichum navitas]KAK1590078.1 hypothetical protein LY79DRAFT_555815 [Colletotrichum navitas]
MHRLKLLLIFCLPNLVSAGWKLKSPFRQKNYGCRSATGSSSHSTIIAGANNIGIVAGDMGNGNALKCSTAQAHRINNTIKNMHEYAGAAYSFLSQPGAERSAAFVAWFGAGNADVHGLTKIRSIFRNIYGLGSTSNHYIRDMENLGQTVGIACQTLHHPGPCHKQGILAYATPTTGQVFVCPVSFIRDQYYLSDESDRATRSLWARSRAFLPTGALTLLHEMTHLQVMSGPCNIIDHAYLVQQCITLDDEKTVSNAQNYMFFALEVISNPANARKQVDWNAGNRWQDAVGKLRADVRGQPETEGKLLVAVGGSNGPHQSHDPYQSHDQYGSINPYPYGSNSPSGAHDFIEWLFGA